MKSAALIAIIIAINTISMRTRAQTIVSESSALASHSNANSATGEIVFTALESDCRQVTLAANVRKKSGPTDGTTADDIWSCGVKWTFKGHVCLQTSWKRIDTNKNIKIEPLPGGSMTRLSGTASFSVPESAAILQIASNPQKPLVFLLTAKGLEYISGTGSVKAPGDKLYDFNSIN